MLISSYISTYVSQLYKIVQNIQREYLSNAEYDLSVFVFNNIHLSQSYSFVQKNITL